MSNVKPLDYFFEDHGYNMACPTCGARHGQKLLGQRDIMIRKCAIHEKQKRFQDEDMERIDKNFWKIDPPSAKFYRKCRDNKRGAAKDRRKAD